VLDTPLFRLTLLSDKKSERENRIIHLIRHKRRRQLARAVPSHNSQRVKTLQFIVALAGRMNGILAEHSLRSVYSNNSMANPLFSSSYILSVAVAPTNSVLDAPLFRLTLLPDKERVRENGIIRLLRNTLRRQLARAVPTHKELKHCNSWSPRLEE
jgi:hypothetical protein